ncbi:MAG: ATP-binding protein [Calditerrivibrio sp.]|nr:ATP-binding protein [Calditerrivibrio sp.]
MNDTITTTAIKYLAIKRDGRILLEVGLRPIICRHIVNRHGYEICIDTDIDEDERIEKYVIDIMQHVGVQDTQWYEENIEILNTILDKKSIDDLLYKILYKILSDNFTDKVAFFALNDRLLKLRGVSYIKKGDTDFVYDNTIIKNCTIDLSQKGKIADTLFFERYEELKIDEIKHKNLERFFTNKVAVFPIAGGYRTIGLLIFQDGVSKEKLTKLAYLGKILSLGIDHLKLNKQLKLSLDDISYLKESLNVSSNLTQMGKLTASVAHEIKNPLVSIGGFAKRLERFISDERGLGYLKIIQTETTRLEQIVNDILSYSKVFSLIKEEVNIKSFLQEIYEIFKDELIINNIQLMISCPNDLHLYLDSKKMKQVFINLIKNSIQSIESNGEIIIEVSKDMDNILITVKDTGEGFPIEVIQKAFEPFVTTKEMGTGLGLSICHKIIKAHGGDIYLDNYENGAIVKIYLPLRGLYEN